MGSPEKPKVRDEAAYERGRKQRLTKMMVIRFGDLSPEHQKLIAQASLRQCEQWASRLLHALTFDDLLVEADRDRDAGDAEANLNVD